MRTLATCLLIYAAASLLHHIHNAEYLAEYPNLPAWLTPAKVYLVWTAEAVLGLVGYLLLRSGYRRAGLEVAAAAALFLSALMALKAKTPG